jgi:DNA-binding YbaB/EbfC family protein
MNPFDLGNMGGLLGGLQQRMADMKEKAANTTVEGVAGGGLVKVSVTCDYHVDAVSISPDAMDDREMLEDLVRAALAEALRQARDETGKGMKDRAGGLPIPPGLIPGL